MPQLKNPWLKQSTSNLLAVPKMQSNSLLAKMKHSLVKTWLKKELKKKKNEKKEYNREGKEDDEGKKVNKTQVFLPKTGEPNNRE